jgi:hypothetical protein
MISLSDIALSLLESLLRHYGLQALKAQKRGRDVLSTPGIQTQMVRGWSAVDELNNTDLVMNRR